MLWQYSLIFHFSKYFQLALTDLNTNGALDTSCMWLGLSQFKKKCTKGNTIDLI